MLCVYCNFIQMALSGDYWEVKYCSSLVWDEEKLSEFSLSTQLWQEHVHMVLILEKGNVSEYFPFTE